MLLKLYLLNLVNDVFFEMDNFFSDVCNEILILYFGDFLNLLNFNILYVFDIKLLCILNIMFLLLYFIGKLVFDIKFYNYNDEIIIWFENLYFGINFLYKLIFDLKLFVGENKFEYLKYSDIFEIKLNEFSKND